MHQITIAEGADVVGPDGPMGKVAHLVVDEATYTISDVVLQRPDGHEWLIPASKIANTTNTTMFLAAPWSELSATARPYDVDEFETLSDGAALLAAVPAGFTRDRSPRRSGDAVQLREEELHLRKRAHDVGAVELRKEVVSERRALDVPVWHEELIVEHQPIDPPQPCDQPIGEDRPLRIVLREEVAVVDKQPVVAEVVRAGRRGVQETHHLETTVRREVADVHTEGDVRLRQSDTHQRRSMPMATFQELAAENPSIRQQYDEWRELRSQNGEDPTDYQAFRQHVISFGAPDPGEQEIDDFVGDDFKAAHPERYGAG